MNSKPYDDVINISTTTEQGGQQGEQEVNQGASTIGCARRNFILQTSRNLQGNHVTNLFIAFRSWLGAWKQRRWHDRKTFPPVTTVTFLTLRSLVIQRFFNLFNK